MRIGIIIFPDTRWPEAARRLHGVSAARPEVTPRDGRRAASRVSERAVQRYVCNA
jgi:hypothetical protein